MTKLHAFIAEDLGKALADLEAAGFAVESSSFEAEASGNYVAEFVAPHAHYRIIRDREEYLFDGPREVLEPHDLWRAYTSKIEFLAALRAFITQGSA